ncbi:MAG: hypothetical protein Q8L55_05305 [Phycisphaerales bacterium]|nr:hypothetical protein [Phycisphaerales bacterium]
MPSELPPRSLPQSAPVPTPGVLTIDQKFDILCMLWEMGFDFADAKARMRLPNGTPEEIRAEAARIIRGTAA